MQDQLQQKQPASTLDVNKLPPQLQQQSHSHSKCCLDHNFKGAQEVKDGDECHIIENMEDSELVPVPVTPAGDADLMKTHDGALTNLQVKVDVNIPETTLVKRKRGRPPKGQARPTPPVNQQDDEDVCFICFDGGSLVLCDRRGCPKAYHPACIKRDEAFFRSRAKWYCGWHICSKCHKASHYMCYTCTYSLCKGCRKDAGYICVRGNYGFCATCMRTIMLIENGAQGTKEKCEVDFDDKSSWEYLFKVYWIYLKNKLSLTLDELTHAQSPWRGDVVMAANSEPSQALNHSRDERVSIHKNSLYIETSDTKRRKTSDDPNCVSEQNSRYMEASGFDRNETLPESTKWASDKLLEFVGHMRYGDSSVLSQFDVQSLLTEYIKENNLRDPLKKCQIICDSRLINLFGKARLGHIEMLKLLEPHFLMCENTSEENRANQRILDTPAGQGESNGCSEGLLTIDGDKRHKASKKIDLQAPKNDLNAYAAIDSHNIKLIYLCRNQMENLIEEADHFHDTVVGSIVRVKIPNGDQKPDMYRLVQVVGTSKVSQRYNVGSISTDLMLEVINLNKKEVVSIDGISNEEFSEDECRRFRQSIKCGLSKCLTVQEVQDKARTFQAMRVNNLLNSQEGRQRRLHEIPEVHCDPKMDPSYESDDEDDSDAGVQEIKDHNLRSRDSGFNAKVAESISPRSKNYVFNYARSCINGTLATNCNQQGGTSIAQNEVHTTAQANGDSNGAMVMISKLSSPLASDCLTSANMKRIERPVDDFESDNIWHYQDPSGKFQGPFSVFQLGKWYAAGLFPADLRVWRNDQKKDDSILLTDALNGKCHESVSPGQFISLGVAVSKDKGDKSAEISNAAHCFDQKLKCSPQHNVSNESVKSNEWNCHLFGLSKRADFVKTKEGQSEVTQTSLDLAKWDVISDGKAQGRQPLPSPALTTTLHPEHDRKGYYRIDINSDANDGNQNLLKTFESQGDQVLQKQSDSAGHSGQSSEVNWRHHPVSGFSSCLDSTSTFVSMSKGAEQSEVIRAPDLPSSTAVNSTSDCWDSKSTFASVTKALQPMEEIDFFELPSPTPRPGFVVRCQAGENKHSPSSNIHVQDAGHSWSTASSLVGGPLPHSEAAVVWREFSTMLSKPSAEEWDSRFVSAASLRSTKIRADDAATPSSINCEQTHSPPTQPACTESNWNVIIGDANEFNSFVDESVSDLLAEVEAMESLGGLDSPTSIMNCGEELTNGSKNDCLCSAERLVSMPDQGKSDALSSTSDAKLPTNTTVREARHAGHQADVPHYQRLSTPLPTACAQSAVAAKKSDASGRPWEAHGVAHVAVQPSAATWDVTDTTWRLGLDSTNASWGATQGNTNVGWSAMKEGNSNMNWGVTQGTGHGNVNLSPCATTGNPAVWGTQTRYVSDRLSSPLDRDCYGRDSSFDRGRTAGIGNRLPFSSMANGGGSPVHRHVPKGQRVCKYYERGHCKKGASCNNWHP